jgi:hypothetical protein
VAAASAALLVWFDKAWIPAQQRYFNERNLRTLRTISTQVKARVDGFAPALDHAIDSAFSSQSGADAALQRYVKLFSQDLEIISVQAQPTPEPAAVSATLREPPSVQIRRADGRNYVYLWYRHDAEHGNGVLPLWSTASNDIELIARADVEQAIAPLLSRIDFDAVLLVDREGDAIAQQSPSGLELTSIDAVLQRQPGVPQEKQHGDAFAHLRGTTNLTRVAIGAADYVLYVQPVQLSMRARSSDSAPLPEEWTVCGLVRLDKFRAASSTISTTYWLWCGVALALICCAIPLAKLRVLSSRERLRRVDGVAASAAIFALMALVTVTALDLSAFGVVMPSALDDQLRGVAESMAAHVRQEIEAIDAQMTAFRGENANGRTLWQQLHYPDEKYNSLDEIRRNLNANRTPKVTLDAGAHHQWKCDPPWSCRSGVLADLADLDALAYPFFKFMTWSDDRGWQRIKWSTAPVVTPFINIDEAKLAYVEPLKMARRFAGDRTMPSAGVSVLPSPNTGEKLTVFWRALPPVDPPPPKPAGFTETAPDLLGEAMATTPVSLTSPVLPKNVQFAVVDRTGRVLFHSDAARSLTENFFQESEDNPALKSLVATRDSGAAAGRYLGRAHRFHVVPLDLEPFGDPRWSVVVFEDAAVGETANLQTINLTVSLFAAYAAVLAALWGLCAMFWPTVLDRWFWPTPTKALEFRRAAIVNTAAALGCVVAMVVLKPAALVLVAGILIAGAFATTFALIRPAVATTRPLSTTWITDFFLARASLLFLLAAAPAMVCFHVAHAFHAELVVKRTESQLANQLDARERRIDAQVQRVAICSAADAGAQPCDRVKATVVRRATQTLWDVDVPATTDPDAMAGEPSVDSALLRSLLSRTYKPYNDIAADLLMTPPPRPGRGLDRWHLSADGALPLPVRHETFTEFKTAWTFAPAIRAERPVQGISIVIPIALFGIACLLVGYVLPPLFASELRAGTTLNPPAGTADDASLLVIGPPGSPRTARLCRHPRVRVFDVRSLSFIDEPINPPSTIDVAADCGHAAEIDDIDWADAIHEATANPLTIVAVDHLEHRFDDQAFRDRLLECLESAVYRRDAIVWCSSSRDPIEHLDACQPPAPDRHRWVRLFDGFRREHLAIAGDELRAASLEQSLATCGAHLPADVRRTIVDECRVAVELLAVGETLADRLRRTATMVHTIPLDREAILAEIGTAAEPFYAALWSSCSADEKVALRQLAEEGLVNPNNPASVLRLLRGGLVRRDRVFQAMNETFRRFVITAVPHETVLVWEHEGVRVPWGSIATTGLTVAFGLAGLLLLTQEQLVDAWISYVPALAPALPTAWKVLANVQKGRLDVTA